VGRAGEIDEPVIHRFAVDEERPGGIRPLEADDGGVGAHFTDGRLRLGRTADGEKTDREQVGNSHGRLVAGPGRGDVSDT
jgi:hypothetical protein